MSSKVEAAEFKKLDKAAWRQLVEKELKGKSYSDFLFGKDIVGKSIEAYQDASDVSSLPLETKTVQSAVQYFASSSTKKGFRIFIEDEQKANKEALEVLKQGVDSILFKTHQAEMDFDVLLKDIDLSLIDVAFCALPHDFLQLLYKLQPKAGASITIELSPFNASFNMAVLASDLKEAKQLAQKGQYQVNLCITFDELAAAGADFALQNAMITKFYNEWIFALRRENFEREGLAATIISHAMSPLFLGEIAKHRALCCQLAERLQAENIVSENFKPGGFRLSFNEIFKGQLDPEVNLIRLSSFAFSAFACNPNTLQLINYKEDGKSYIGRVSANIANVLIEESKLNHYIDPAAGSYYVEHYTQEILSSALETYKKINLGDWHVVTHNKKVNEMISEAGKTLIDSFKNGELKMIGENLYPPANTEVEAQLEILNLK